MDWMAQYTRSHVVPTMNKDIIEYIDLLYQIIGVDIDFERFKSMTAFEKQEFIRDIKINKILNNVVFED